MGYVTKNNPIGVDIVINSIITSMYESLEYAGWRDYNAYHRAYKNPKDNSGNFVPEAYVSEQDGDNDYEEVLMDDKLKSTSFFITGSTTNYNEGLYKLPISIIFQLNSQELYPNSGHRADEEARNDAIVAIRNSAYGDGITSIVTDIPNVYTEFDTSNITFTDMNPMHVFRINLDVIVDYSCDYICTYPPITNGGFEYSFNFGFEN